MNLKYYRTSLVRASGAAVVAAAALAAGLPGIAHADAGDRAVYATVDNSSGVRLNLSQSDLGEGKWTSEPPSAIKTWSKARFGTLSSTDEGGTEATVVYRTKYGNVEIYWNHPWASDDEITCDAPSELSCNVYSDGHAKEKVTFSISES